MTATPASTALLGRQAQPPAQRGDGRARRSPLLLGLVNNMPDSAFADTDAQFASLLETSGTGPAVRLRRYAMASVERGADVQPLLAGYHDATEIYDDPPDALIVTGTEPRCADLRDEPYWDELSGLLAWAQRSVSSVLLSCLSAHASVLAVDGLARRRLPDKCCGVFDQQIDHEHPLARGLRSVSFPHSRQNEIDTAELRGVGYEVIAESATGGWTVAARQRGDSLTVMFQGHPEYSRDTLLREYRRDVRRFLEGERDTYPALPVGYLDRDGQTLLTQFRDAARLDASLIDSFPFAAALGHVRADWRVASQRLVNNWLAHVEQARTTSGR
jgi:homoserine O-succinyltransferase/O-acetyltransferase